MSTAPRMQENSDEIPTPTARPSAVVLFTTSDGRRIGGRKTYDWPVTADQQGDPFQLTWFDENRAALRSVCTGKYLSVQTGTISASAEEPGENGLWLVTEAEDGKITLGHASGSGFLSAPAGDPAFVTLVPVAGPTELFTMETLDLSRFRDGEHGHCCNAWAPVSESEEAGVLWNDLTHKKIVGNAIDSLRLTQTEQTKQFFQIWDNYGDTFRTRVEDGLHDADYQFPWKGDHVWKGQTAADDISTWHDHFYNPGPAPNLWLNYQGRAHPNGYPGTNAATEGRRYFNLSVYEGMRVHAYESANPGRKAPGEWYLRAAYYLGLSLHFLTDLTQPMHAANFTNGYGENGKFSWIAIPNTNDKRHSLFEKYADGLVAAGYLNQINSLTPAEMATDDVTEVFWFLHYTAVNQRHIFDTYLREPLSRTFNWSKQDELPVNDANFKQALPLSLLKAPKAVARYLMYWNLCIRQSWDIDTNHWYRIEEPTKNEWICLHNGTEFRRWNYHNEQGRVFFIHNSDGTWSVGSAADPDLLWNGSPLEPYRGSGLQPPGSARFRFVRNGRPGGDDRVWIFENEKHAWAKEVLGVRGDGSVVRWEPDDVSSFHKVFQPSQLFRLRKMEPIPDSFRTRIRQRWPNSTNVPWYGQP